MKSIVALVLMGALVVVAQSDEGVKVAEGVAGFPTLSVSGLGWKNKINKMLETFNNMAGSASKLVAEEVGNLIKISGGEEILVFTKNGESSLFPTIYINRYGRVFEDIGREIKEARGIVYGNKNRIESLSDSALEKIKDSFKETEGFVSSVPNDIWVFGQTTFDAAAMIASKTARIITELGVDTWSKFKPLSEADKSEVAKMVESGLNVAIEPAKIFVNGVGAGFDAGKKMFGVAAGVPLAMGSSFVRSGANLVSNGANLFGRLADDAGNYGKNMAGLKY